jgi:hypothetical protein
LAGMVSPGYPDFFANGAAMKNLLLTIAFFFVAVATFGQTDSASGALASNKAGPIFTFPDGTTVLIYCGYGYGFITHPGQEATRFGVNGCTEVISGPAGGVTQTWTAHTPLQLDGTTTLLSANWVLKQGGHSGRGSTTGYYWVSGDAEVQ